MAPKTLLFAGAPAPSSLSPETCTLNHFEKHLANFLNLPLQDSDGQVPSSHAAWRSLPLTRQVLHTGFSQRHDITDSFRGQNCSDFFTTADASVDEQTRAKSGFGSGSFDSDDGSALLSQFCEHSLAIHNSIPSSQLSQGSNSSVSHDYTTSALDETSFMATSSTSALEERSMANVMPPPPIPVHLSDLKEIPSASKITALNPQTVSLNLIAGVISIAQPRTITTRRGRTLNLLEILIGDETRSGFAVTFWLDSSSAAEAPVSKLRRQDVVLMQNVALHVFNGKVYGQSLRRGMTKVSVLWRRDNTGYYSGRDLMRKGSNDAQKEKTKKVKDWVLKFVGGDPAVTRTSKRRRKSWDRPPDDSQ